MPYDITDAKDDINVLMLRQNRILEILREQHPESFPELKKVEDEE